MGSIGVFFLEIWSDFAISIFSLRGLKERIINTEITGILTEDHGVIQLKIADLPGGSL
jgi:hypothetical protein